ncbi:hypothetical protein PGT21_008211 [Puccinia graminis f. sp. tritici]|uniref:Uncharacterized protein n=1 Tax=Puccinia graminis f. sp. tritici TaxID=56615 RepID=A0A5B0NBX6_PUCGR|nr:hypothetical protein PGT21_008211 [Puccinia graminis f. sp. tritici]
METSTEESPALATGRHHQAAPPPEEFPLLNFYKALRADPSRQSETGTLNLDATTESLLLQLIKSEARQSHDLKLFTKELREVRLRVTTIEAGQLTRKPPSPSKTYVSTAAKTGTKPLKEVDTEIVVRKTNKVLEKLNATFQGEKVTVKAVRSLPSGDVSFYSKNRQQKEWLNHNKHEWSKQVHPQHVLNPSSRHTTHIQCRRGDKQNHYCCRKPVHLGKNLQDVLARRLQRPQ